MGKQGKGTQAVPVFKVRTLEREENFQHRGLPGTAMSLLLAWRFSRQEYKADSPLTSSCITWTWKSWPEGLIITFVKLSSGPDGENTYPLKGTK